MNTTHESVSTVSSGNVNVEHPTISDWSVTLISHSGKIGGERILKMLEDSYITLKHEGKTYELLTCDRVDHKTDGFVAVVLHNGIVERLELDHSAWRNVQWCQYRGVPQLDVVQHIEQGFPLPVKYRRGGNLTLEYIDASKVTVVPCRSVTMRKNPPVTFEVEGETVSHGWRYCIVPELMAEAIRVHVTGFANQFSEHKRKFQHGETIRHVHEGWYAAVVGTPLMGGDKFAPDLFIVRGPKLRPEPAYSIEFEKV